ncbi:chromate transporter [Rhodopseudomonas thermotolerans]|uniref:Chromate transporter n=2 Tax=Rhodopseudomonas TaxID=1073 RepID=A0A336JJ60_9BRAD|nr:MULTISPECIES: chromate efflux transporter [Rhodopseudomonas]RED38304.1 chromate transporter [Rhodopseudomonas pentothenatexigens]REG05889.1 chromate transporter [Rhodopseudomonas thermotolerans]SSW89757.1 chromate transporter [Rhodopseudomonas pentothenatexigens]
MTAQSDLSTIEQPHSGTPGEVLRVFFKLGLTCFGGPIAHLGYFRDEFVVRRRWTDEQAYADLVGLCQFLPGPASSQVGFAIGLMRAGTLGALAAWAGFTLPSAAALVLFAYGAAALDGPIGTGLLHGLKLTAVAIVAQAVWGMSRQLCPDRERTTIAVAAALIVLLSGVPAAQLGAIAIGAIAGLVWCRSGAAPRFGEVGARVSRTVGIAALFGFATLLVGLPLLAQLAGSPIVATFDAFYRSGALVFGGGHVVLPLLRDAFVGPGWISDDAFLAGYGAAQAVPGPLFSFAAYLGAIAAPSQGLTGAVIGLVGIFLPGFLILLGVLPFWHGLRHYPAAQAMMRGVNATVVGLLGAALYDPVWTSTIHGTADVAIALTGFALLTIWRAPPLLIVAFSAAAGIAAALL